MLQGLGLKYYPAQPTIAYVKAWLALGYPVMICGAESGFYDLDLGDVTPYSWTPSGNHCIVASGIASDGNLLVRDTASIAPTGVRPGPRRYDAGKMQLISVTAIGIPWLPILATNYDPTKGGTSMPSLPANWHDDGTTLSCPGGELVLGFRAYVLPLLLNGAWDAGNYALGKQFSTPLLEASNTALGGGDQVLFLYGDMLGYPHNPQAPYEHLKSVVIREYAGKELAFCRGQLATYYNEYKAAQTQIATLQEQLKQVQQPTGIAEATVKDRLTAIGLAATNGNATIQQLVTQSL